MRTPRELHVKALGNLSTVITTAKINAAMAAKRKKQQDYAAMVKRRHQRQAKHAGRSSV